VVLVFACVLVKRLPGSGSSLARSVVRKLKAAAQEVVSVFGTIIDIAPEVYLVKCCISPNYLIRGRSVVFFFFGLRLS
jgi:hypothetical protein